MIVTINVAGGVARAVRQSRQPRPLPSNSAAPCDGSRGSSHPFLGRRFRSLCARDGRPPGRRDGSGTGSERPVPAVGFPRLFRAPVEPGHQDLRAGDHCSQEEVRREHPGCGLPPPPAVHRQRRRRRPR